MKSGVSLRSVLGLDQNRLKTQKSVFMSNPTFLGVKSQKWPFFSDFCHFSRPQNRQASGGFFSAPIKSLIWHESRLFLGDVFFDTLSSVDKNCTSKSNFMWHPHHILEKLKKLLDGDDFTFYFMFYFCWMASNPRQLPNQQIWRFIFVAVSANLLTQIGVVREAGLAPPTGGAKA